MHLVYGPINTWPGEYQVTHLVDVLSIAYRRECGGFKLYFSVFNVGFWIGLESRAYRRARRERMELFVKELLAGEHAKRKERGA